MAINAEPPPKSTITWVFQIFSKRVCALTSLPLQRAPIARYQLFLNRSAGLQNAVPDPVPGPATVNAAVGQLDHLIQIERWIASALPIQHHRAVKFIERHFGCPAMNQIIVPPDAPIAILSRKLADFGAAVVTQIVVGLVIRIGSIVGKATDQAALMLVGLLILVVEIAIHTVPHAFMAGEQRHGFTDIGHGREPFLLRNSFVAERHGKLFCRYGPD